MAKWKIWAGILVLFASGVVIGSVGTRMVVRHKISGLVARERPVIRDLFLRRLTRELDLTKEQRREIETIANRTAERFQNLHRQHRGEVEGILDQAVSDMKEHLSPAQRQQLDEIRKEMKARHKRRMRGRHGPDHPPPFPGPHPPPPPMPPPPAGPPPPEGG